MGRTVRQTRSDYEKTPTQKVGADETENTSTCRSGQAFPLYLMIMMGIWKISGVVAVLVPKLPLLKEWAYAGFFFAMSGAVYAHIAVGDGAQEIFGPALLLVLTVVSWYFRPANRSFDRITRSTG